MKKPVNWCPVVVRIRWSSWTCELHTLSRPMTADGGLFGTNTLETWTRQANTTFDLIPNANNCVTRWRSVWRSNFGGWCKREKTLRLSSLVKQTRSVYLQVSWATKIRENAWHFDFELLLWFRQGSARLFKLSHRRSCNPSHFHQEKSRKSQSRVPRTAAQLFIRKRFRSIDQRQETSSHCFGVSRLQKECLQWKMIAW